jgi:chromate transport protein ChrA
MNLLIERIFKNWKTTLLGLAMIVACFVLVFLEKASLTEASVFIVGGFTMLFLRDSADSASKPTKKYDGE